MIRFKQPAELEIVEWYDEANDETHTKDETFSEGEVVDADIFDDRGETVNMQFGDGSVAYGVPKTIFEEIEETS